MTTSEEQNTLSLETSSSNEQFTRIAMRIESGEIRIPHFQRGIVWDTKKTAALLDSVLKNVPFGKITFWESTLSLADDRLIIPTTRSESFSVFKYILDGQQRITSLYKTFNASIPEYKDYRKIYVDATINPKTFTLDALAFFKPSNENPKHFPVYMLFDENPKLRALLREMSFEVEEQDNLFDYKERLSNFYVHYDTVKTEHQEVAASVFVAINNGSSKLTETDIMAAILFDQNSDWYFHSKAELLRRETESRGFEITPKRQLQLLSLISFGDYQAKFIPQLTPREVIPFWGRFRIAINQAIDYLKTDLKINKMSDLFSDSLFNTIFFFFFRNRRNPNLIQRKNIHKLILSRGLLSKYKTSTVTAVKQDVQLIPLIIQDESISIEPPLRYRTEEERHDVVAMGDFKKVSTLPYYPKCFLLLLGLKEPKSIENGLPVFGHGTEQINNVERHHIFPKSTHGDASDNIFNIMLLDSASNNAIGNNHPSAYLTKERYDSDEEFRAILERHFIGRDEIIDIERDDLESFKLHRMIRMMDYLNSFYVESRNAQ